MMVNNLKNSIEESILKSYKYESMVYDFKELRKANQMVDAERDKISLIKSENETISKMVIKTLDKELVIKLMRVAKK